MSNVWIVAKRDSLDYPFENVSTETVRYQMLSPSDVGIAASRKDLIRPDLLVVDLESIQHPVDMFMEHLSQVNPEATIIVLSSSKSPVAPALLSQLNVDEIINRPQDAREVRLTVETLFKSIAVFDRLQALQEILQREMHQYQIIARSHSMREIMHHLPQLASSRSTVLITGETGTGKELIARAIHYLGPRAGRPFITLDCGTIPEHLVENELFGHVRGAYTDAASTFKGLIQEADGGTLFLDEVESLPLPVQSKFLRFLQERQYKPLGQSRFISVDVRVLAATNVELSGFVKRKLFREDLYYRLKVVPLSIPPLRERKADIPKLVPYFLRRHTAEQQPPTAIPSETIRQWMEYDWPGNVRELENKVQEWLTLRSDRLYETTEGETSAQESHRQLSEVRREVLARCDQDYLRNVLSKTRGNISAAARLAGTDRKNLRSLLKKYGIDVSRFRS